MPIVDRLKKFIRGDEKKPPSKNVPSVVRLETDVADYWTLQEVIGDGAFGSVYKAVSKSDPNRVAAAKAMELDDEEGTDVMVEVEILSSCLHPNIVQLYDAFTLGNRITLLLEFCGGGAIDSIMIELSRGLTEVQIHYVMREILKALDFLHGKNVIHRDLKAGNVLLTYDAKVKLADFGVSALCKDAREERSTFIGTPYWMAPEVMLCETFPEKKYSKLADIWSFGITLIEMADERPPYSDMNPAKVVFKIIKADAPTLEKPNLWSNSFRDAISHCLTKDPMNRPTAADLLSHPFFAKEGDARSVQRLIYEMNAEQVTTEVMDSELEDDDDTSSSTDLRSGGDTHNELIELLGEEKGRLYLKNMMKSDSVPNGEVDRPQSTTVSVAPQKLIVPVRAEKKHRAPDAPVEREAEATSTEPSVAFEKTPRAADSSSSDMPPDKISRVTPTRSEDVTVTELNACPISPTGRAALFDALSVLDDALELENSLNHGIPDEPTLIAPSPLLPIGEDDDSSSMDEEKTPKQAFIPSHQIKDLVEQAKHSASHSHVEVRPPSRPPSRQLTPTPPPREITFQDHIKRPQAFAHVIHTVNAVQKSVPGKLTVTVAAEKEVVPQRAGSEGRRFPHPAPLFRPPSTHSADHAQDVHVAPLKKAVSQNQALEKKSVESLIEKKHDHARFIAGIPHKGSPHRSSSQPITNVKRPPRTEIAVGGDQSLKRANDASSVRSLASGNSQRPASEVGSLPISRPREASVNGNIQFFEKAASAAGSPRGVRKQHMRAAFHVVPPAGRELTLVEVRRPFSFPESLATHARSNKRLLPSSTTSSTTSTANQNAPPHVALMVVSAEKKEKSPTTRHSVVMTGATVGHDVSPTTSNGPSLRSVPSVPADYNYFGTVSSTSSNLNSGPSSSDTHEKGDSVFSTAPPPEPPVDYDDERKAAMKAKAAENAAKKSSADQMGSRKSPHRQTVTRKTRVYMVDGVQMTSTSHQVFGVKQDFELRKQQLHDLRRLQREEARQQRELNAKAETLRNEQAKRFVVEKENVVKASEVELLALSRNQKRQMREAEESHNEDMKGTMKKIQYDQEKEMRAFKEVLKHEHKKLKIDVETLPKAQRKEIFRMRREQLEKEQIRREADFLEQQQSSQNVMLMTVQVAHKLKIKQLERTFQQQKHAVLRTREASEWDLEERQLGERHLLYKQELKDRFFLQRTQMLNRHQRELEHMRKVNEMDEIEALRNYAIYKKKLPKDFRTESKMRIAMFKESLRISNQNEDPSIVNEKMRAFEEKEKIRVRNAIDDHEAKAGRKLKELKERNLAAIKELEEIHNEKRKMLWEAEQNKMEMYEKEYEQVIADWKANLPLRKQELEAQFAKELDELDAFYRKESAQLQSITSKPIGGQGSF